MRRLIALAAAAALLLAAGCKRKLTLVGTEEEQNQRPLSRAESNDPRTRFQLFRGFHGIEPFGWCWTQGRFSLALAPPAGSDAAVLELSVTMAGPLLSRKGPVTLSVRVNGAPLDPETYSKPGDFSYRRDVPAAALRPFPVRVDCSLDRYLASGEVENRELGLIFHSAALRPKPAPEPAGKSRRSAG
jgi:hypothetical protein